MADKGTTKGQAPDKDPGATKKSPFNFKEQTIGVEDLWKAEEPGDTIIGYLRKVSSMNTKVGASGYLDINSLDENYDVILNPETGDPLKTTIFLSAGLANYPWQEWIGKCIKITYTGDQVNARSGQTFKSFQVFVAN